MANIKSAIKRARQNPKRRLHNAGQRSKMRTYIKQVLAAIIEGNHEKAQSAFRLAQAVVDKMANKGIIHKNHAARYKTRLNAKVKQLAQA